MTLPDPSIDRLRGLLKQDTTLTGQTVHDRFELRERVARGGMADIYLAFDRQLKRLVAIKFLRGVTEGEVERFNREAEQQAALSHPNIVTIHERGFAFGMAYIALQYIEGPSLDGNKLPATEAIEVLFQVAMAAEYAHRRGVIHTDIKPANILVSADRHVYLTDFGLSMSRGEGLVLGTPEYMSPEQAQGSASLDARTDVYALGATLYALLSGSAPFHGRTTQEVLKQVAESAPPALRDLDPSLSRDLQALIRKAMARAPTDRYPSAGALADDLKRLMSDNTLVARKRAILSKVIRRARRHRGILFAALIGLAGIGAGAYFAWDSLRNLSAERESLRRRERAQKLVEESYRSIEKARTQLHGQGALEPMFSDLRSTLAALDESTTIFELAEARYLRGRVLTILARFSEAEEEFNRGLQLEPSHEGCLAYRGRLFLDRALASRYSLVRRDDRRADRLIRKALGDFVKIEQSSTKVDPIDHALIRAYEALLGNQTAYARELADAGLSRFSETSGGEEFSIVRGLACADEVRIPEALEAFSQSLIRRPNYYEAYFFRGLVQFKSLQVEQARQDLQRALRIHSGFARACVALGLILERQGNTEDAEKQLTRAIELDPLDPDGHLARASLWMKRKQTGPAIQDYIEAMKCASREEEPSLALGSLAFQRGQYPQVVEHLTRALEMDPQFDAAVLIRANAYLQMQDYDRAEADFRRYLEFAPYARPAVEPWLVRCRNKE